MASSKDVVAKVENKPAAVGYSSGALTTSTATMNSSATSGELGNILGNAHIDFTGMTVPTKLTIGSANAVQPPRRPWGEKLTSGIDKARLTINEDKTCNDAGLGLTVAASLGGLTNRDFTIYTPCKAGCRIVALPTRKERQLIKKLKALEKAQPSPAKFTQRLHGPPRATKQEQQHLQALLDRALKPAAQAQVKNIQDSFTGGLGDVPQLQDPGSAAQPTITADIGNSVSPAREQRKNAEATVGIKEFARAVSESRLDTYRKVSPVDVENSDKSKVDDTVYSRGRSKGSKPIVAEYSSIDEQTKKEIKAGPTGGKKS